MANFHSTLYCLSDFENINILFIYFTSSPHETLFLCILYILSPHELNPCYHESCVVFYSQLSDCLPPLLDASMPRGTYLCNLNLSILRVGPVTLTLNQIWHNTKLLYYASQLLTRSLRPIIVHNGFKPCPLPPPSPHGRNLAVLGTCHHIFSCELSGSTISWRLFLKWFCNSVESKHGELHVLKSINVLGRHEAFHVQPRFCTSRSLDMWDSSRL